MKSLVSHLVPRQFFLDGTELFIGLAGCFETVWRALWMFSLSEYEALECKAAHTCFLFGSRFSSSLCFAQANIKMNWLPLTTISVIITGNGPESHNNKNRAGGAATGLLRTFCCYAFPFHSIPFHPSLCPFIDSENYGLIQKSMFITGETNTMAEKIQPFSYSRKVWNIKYQKLEKRYAVSVCIKIALYCA